MVGVQRARPPVLTRRSDVSVCRHRIPSPPGRRVWGWTALPCRGRGKLPGFSWSASALPPPRILMCLLRTAVRPPDGREPQRPLMAVPVGSFPLQHRPARGFRARGAALFLTLRRPPRRCFASTHAVVVCSPHTPTTTARGSSVPVCSATHRLAARPRSPGDVDVPHRRHHRRSRRRRRRRRNLPPPPP